MADNELSLEPLTSEQNEDNDDEATEMADLAKDPHNKEHDHDRLIRTSPAVFSQRQKRLFCLSAIVVSALVTTIVLVARDVANGKIRDYTAQTCHSFLLL